ncbi:hypothetical protein B2G71_05190 [Novosphingobium sp. PC22D]|nr:hypothetical protein B2G71_05190 [Novosphingobium sp. PC22D]
MGLSPLGLGCSRIGSFNNPQSLGESRALIEAALDMGVTTLDTANIYGQGDSEKQIGRAVSGRRDKAFIVTKAGRGFSTKMRVLAPLKPLIKPALAARKRRSGPPESNAVSSRREDALRMDWSPHSLARSLDGSLARLGTDHVDGFLLHSPPAGIARDAGVAQALAELKAQGKVRHFGVSCDDRECFEAAMSMPGITLVQLPWTIVAGLRDQEVLHLAERGIAVMAREIVRMQPALKPLDAVRSAISHPAVGCTLVGTTSRKHLEALAELTVRQPETEGAAP